VPFVLFRALNENGFLLLKRLPSPGNRGLQLTCLNAALYTVYSRWARTFARRASSHSACAAPESGLPAGISEISQSFRELMSSVKATQLRPGMVVQHEGQLFTVFSVDHRTPGNKRGSMQTRMKNLRTGVMIDYRFRAEEFVDRAILDEVEFEYLYNEGDEFHFMNTQTYEQMQMTREELGETVYYLVPNTTVKIEFFEEKPIGVDLPDTMELKVLDTEPTLQKATASAVMKPATLETGLVIQVPPFVNSGDRVKVDTTEARYVQRVE
jgi:elongation factor P